MINLGEFDVSQVIDFKFTSRGSTGAPTTLSGSPAVLVYKGSSTTESASTGITLTVDFDSRTGMNHVNIDMSANTSFFTTATDFDVVITAGTVGGVSVVGETVAHFSIRSRAGVYPATAGRNVNVDSSGFVGLQTGTGSGQLDFTSGVVKANWVQVLASAITGTAAQLAAAISNFFNVATPTGTVNSLPAAVPGATNGLVICGNNVATTFAVLTVTGAFSINGTNTVSQTGDSFARVGAAGAGLTAIGDTRMARLDVDVSSRMATYTQPSGFLAATFPGGTISNTTNITAGVITTATNLTNFPAIPNNWLTAAGIATGALNGKGDWVTSVPSVSAIVNGVLDEQQVNHLAAGSIGSYIDGKTSTAISNTAKLPASYTVGSTTSAPVFTAAVLINAPTGGGGGGGSGADICTMTITQTGTGTPIANANVWITSDAAGTTIVAGSLPTKTDGTVVLLLDAGVTYYLWMQKDGEQSIQGQVFVAVAD